MNLLFVNRDSVKALLHSTVSYALLYGYLLTTTLLVGFLACYGTTYEDPTATLIAGILCLAMLPAFASVLESGKGSDTLVFFLFFLSAGTLGFFIGLPIFGGSEITISPFLYQSILAISFYLVIWCIFWFETHSVWRLGEKS